jgi:hypothetical protein
LAYPEVDTVQVTELPSLTLETLGLTLAVGTLVSLTVTVDEVTTMGPLVEPVRTCMIMVSEPSVVASLVRVLLILPEVPLMLKLPEFCPSVKSAPVVVPPLVQYRVVGELYAVTVQVTVPPSLTLDTLGLMAKLLVASDTLTVADVATMGPDVLPVRTSNIMVSVPSSVSNCPNVRLTEPVLLLIVKLPEFTAAVKSLKLVVPELVQYRVVPLAMLVVVIVQVTEFGSDTLVVLGLTEYVGAASATFTVVAVATMGPEVEPVRTWNMMVSVPSTPALFKVVIDTEPALLVIVKLPLLAPPLKSVPSVVPPLVQYKVVLLGTLVVVTLNVTELPSVILVVVGLTEYVGAASATLTVDAVATMGPDVLPVLTLKIMVSVPS